jgi:hypothetical protein
MLTSCIDRLRGMMLLAVVLTVFSGTAAAERRVALVIGNDDYRYFRSLSRAVADASAMRDTLQRYGFDVIYRANADRREIDRVLEEFTAKLFRGDVALFYFAGHGIQINDVNYLIPIDNSVPAQGIHLADTVEKISLMKPRFLLAIIDACRNNPYRTPTARGLGEGLGGLAAMAHPATGTMIVYSAGVNQTALDDLGPGDRDPNGLFTRELLRYMSQQPDLPISEMIVRVKEAVIAKAQSVNRTQTPAVYDQSTGVFAFVNPANGWQAGSPFRSPPAAPLPSVGATVAPVVSPPPSTRLETTVEGGSVRIHDIGR